MSTRAIDNSNNAYVDPDLWVEHTCEGPLKGLTFASKDLFDVSTAKFSLNPRFRDRLTHHSVQLYSNRRAVVSDAATLTPITPITSCLQIQGHVTGYGQPTWRATHAAAAKTSLAVQVHRQHSAFPKTRPQSAL